MGGFSHREFRDALGLFPTGVCVVTASGGAGGLCGITVNSFTSVSLNPPLILISLARSLYSLPLFLAADSFAVNILSEDQQEFSDRFARALSDKWKEVPVRTGAIGCPVLRSSLAVLECRKHAEYDGGDHVLVLGRVEYIETAKQARPLVYYLGQYCSLGSGSHGDAPGE